MTLCPICKSEIQAKRNPFRPFCSERCKLIDLSNWLGGRYRISTPGSSPADEERDHLEPNGSESGPE
ncbi:MAG: DNA gyrase inhibitor YacG [Candidatus Acidiferrales bacterium]